MPLHRYDEVSANPSGSSRTGIMLVLLWVEMTKRLWYYLSQSLIGGHP